MVKVVLSLYVEKLDEALLSDFQSIPFQPPAKFSPIDYQTWLTQLGLSRLVSLSSTLSSLSLPLSPSQEVSNNLMPMVQPVKIVERGSKVSEGWGNHINTDTKYHVAIAIYTYHVAIYTKIPCSYICYFEHTTSSVCYRLC